MFTHLSGSKSRVEIDQRAREGRLRQEWREAPHENERVSIPVIFWSVLGLVAQLQTSSAGRHRNSPLPISTGPRRFTFSSRSARSR
jgi:hypothetical protein